MARALECPACGAKHRVDNLTDAPTFRCDRCGQVLKVPTSVTTGGPPPPARSSGTATVAPPPRRRGSEVVSPATVGVSATVAAVAPGDESPDPSTRRGRRTAPPSTPRRTKVAWYWRLISWIVAVPLGFVLTVWPAYQLGFIKKNDLLDIFVGTGTGRYARLAIVTAVWALVTALLVQLFVEGGRGWMARRRNKSVSS